MQTEELKQLYERRHNVQWILLRLFVKNYIMKRRILVIHSKITAFISRLFHDDALKAHLLRRTDIATWLRNSSNLYTSIVRDRSLRTLSMEELLDQLLETETIFDEAMRMLLKEVSSHQVASQAFAHRALELTSTSMKLELAVQNLRARLAAANTALKSHLANPNTNGGSTGASATTTHLSPLIQGMTSRASPKFEPMSLSADDPRGSTSLVPIDHLADANANVQVQDATNSSSATKSQLSSTTHQRPKKPTRSSSPSATAAPRKLRPVSAAPTPAAVSLGTKTHSSSQTSNSENSVHGAPQRARPQTANPATPSSGHPRRSFAVSLAPYLETLDVKPSGPRRRSPQRPQPVSNLERPQPAVYNPSSPPTNIPPLELRMNEMVRDPIPDSEACEPHSELFTARSTDNSPRDLIVGQRQTGAPIRYANRYQHDLFTELVKDSEQQENKRSKVGIPAAWNVVQEAAAIKGSDEQLPKPKPTKPKSALLASRRPLSASGYNSKYDHVVSPISVYVSRRGMSPLALFAGFDQSITSAMAKPRSTKEAVTTALIPGNRPAPAAASPTAMPPSQTEVPVPPPVPSSAKLMPADQVGDSAEKIQTLDSGPAPWDWSQMESNAVSAFGVPASSMPVFPPHLMQGVPGTPVTLVPATSTVTGTVERPLSALSALRQARHILHTPGEKPRHSTTIPTTANTGIPSSSAMEKLPEHTSSAFVTDQEPDLTSPAQASETSRPAQQFPANATPSNAPGNPSSVSQTEVMIVRPEPTATAVQTSHPSSALDNNTSDAYYIDEFYDELTFE